MSEWSQRRKVSVDTPAAVASSDLSIAFIGFRSNFPQLLSAFPGSFRLHLHDHLGNLAKPLPLPYHRLARRSLDSWLLAIVFNLVHIHLPCRLHRPEATVTHASRYGRNPWHHCDLCHFSFSFLWMVYYFVHSPRHIMPIVVLASVYILSGMLSRVFFVLFAGL